MTSNINKGKVMGLLEDEWLKYWPAENTLDDDFSIGGEYLTIEDIRHAFDHAWNTSTQPQWRDVSTAPKDGCRILLNTPWGVIVGQWRDEEPASDCARATIYEGWASEGGETWPPHNMGDEGDTEQHGPPTHWMPLPDPPAVLV